MILHFSNFAERIVTFATWSLLQPTTIFSLLSQLCPNTQYTPVNFVFVSGQGQNLLQPCSKAKRELMAQPGIEGFAPTADSILQLPARVSGIALVQEHV
jgi:hypothetical protein